MKFLNYLESVISVSEELKKQLNQVCKKTNVKKGESLLNMNERCKNLYFIEKELPRA
jgi:hypothetical protein